MRRVPKASPPKNVSPSGQQPCSLHQAELQLKASLPDAANKVHHARERFDALDKKELRKVMFEEQKHICVYCERRVKEKEGVEPPPIEHWKPLKHYPHLALHWKNLYLSCDSRETCDDCKKHRRLVGNEEDHEDLPWPSDTQYETWLGFTSDGWAYVRKDAPIDDAKRKALQLALAGYEEQGILGLNHPALRAARRDAIDDEQARMEKDFPDRHASTDDRRARAEERLNENPYPPHVSVRVAYLRKTLGKKR
ncbi:retron system putative HNH endonuclease [Sorangium sp. So ce1182]|uniref:retron system putative HNH endonuclease n=1 Tax=Sorangium sp. So ce1182 TaxID=3133334 RepID=UPI003F5E4BEB